MRKKVLLYIIIFAILSMAAAVVALTVATARRNSVTIDSPTASTGRLPLLERASRVEFWPGVRFAISTESTLSAIDRPTLERLKAIGCAVDSSRTVMFGNVLGNGREMVTHIYSVDLPFATYEYIYDSIAGYPLPHTCFPLRAAGYIRNVEFVEAPEGTPNSIGNDVLSHLVMEFFPNDSALALHHSAPENYVFCGKIYPSRDVIDYVTGAGPQYYLDMRVDHIPHTFMLNSALTGVSLKMPSADKVYLNAESERRDITLPGDETRPAVIDKDVWCEFGTRAGSRMVYYFDNDGESYQINPLEFFHQDLLIDFPSHSVLFHPTADLSRQLSRLGKNRD